MKPTNNRWCRTALQVKISRISPEGQPAPPEPEHPWPSTGGPIVNETSNSLTLRRPEAEDLTLLKAAVAEVRASSVSLMPDGFEDGINPRQMADLIAYLQEANLQ